MKKKLDFSKLSVQSFVTTLNPDQDYKLKGGNTGDIRCTDTATVAASCPYDCTFNCTNYGNICQTKDSINCIIKSAADTADTKCFETELCTVSCHTLPPYAPCG